MISKFLLATIFSFVFPLFAQETLRWGVDLESGAPFSYKDPKDPSRVIGFEAEIVELIARELGLKVEIVQNNWEGLIEGLNRRDYDIVVNGLEITPDRKNVVRFSIPYYIGAERITVARTTSDIETLESLAHKRVGTLTGALAQRILKSQKFPMDVVGYSEEVHLYNDLALGRIDAVLLDETIALYYGKPNPALKVVGPPIGYMEYGIATRRDDNELSTKIDQVLARKIKDGSIRKILERWGIWNELTAKAWTMSVEPETTAIQYEEFIAESWKERTFRERLTNYASYLPMLGIGAVKTLQISILSMALAILIGVIVAVTRLYGPWIFAAVGTAFVEVFRGTPLLIQLYLIFYGLPHLGIKIPPFIAAVIGLGLNYGANEAENYRAGILSIHRSQMDAALALGLSKWQALRHVIIPQAMRVVLPPVTNDFIALLKDSSLVSIITMVELTTMYGQLASTYFDYLGLGLLTAAIYFLIGLPFVRLSRWLERRTAHGAK